MAFSLGVLSPAHDKKNALVLFLSLVSTNSGLPRAFSYDSMTELNPLVRSHHSIRSVQHHTHHPSLYQTLSPLLESDCPGALRQLDLVVQHHWTGEQVWS